MNQPPLDISIEPTYNPNVPSIGFDSKAYIEVLRLLSSYYPENSNRQLGFFTKETLSLRQDFDKALKEDRVYYLTDDEARDVLHHYYYISVVNNMSDQNPRPENINMWYQMQAQYNSNYRVILNKSRQGRGGKEILLEYNPLMAH